MAITGQPGALRKEPDGFAVTFERYFPYDTMTVWDGLTNPEKLALWFFPVTIDLRPGGKIGIRFPDGTPSTCRITQVQPGRLFEFIWESMDEGPDELARWELFPEGNGSKLVLNYSRMIDRYAISVPTGWHVMLNDLAEVVQGRREPLPQPEGRTPEQLAIEAEYAAMWYRQFAPFKLSSNYGTVRPFNGRFDIIFERQLPHPVQQVWEAITKPEKLAQWLGGPAETDLRPGGKISIGLLMTTVEGVITRVENEKLLEYTWGADNVVIRWELEDNGNGTCRLVFTETSAAAEDLPDAMPGWHGYLDFLEMVLDGEKVPAFPLEGWPEIAKEVTDRYKAVLPVT
jgi:uncharacterized protein YndB with AHSA1/START domain